MRASSAGRPRAAGVLLAVAALVVAVACTRPVTPPEPTQPPQPTEPAPRRGGVLRAGVLRPASLDPAKARTIDELLVADQLFDSLTAYDPATLEPVASLAARWQATADQRHWDFFLRPGAVFANGRPITATDVKYSLERVARKETGASVADLLEPVTGFNAFAVEGTAAELAGVSAPSPDVVHIDLDHPLSVLPSVLGNPALAVVPREAVEVQPPVADFGTEPVGSGPFRLQARTDTAISLAAAGGSPALLEGIELRLFDSVEASYAAFGRGELDWTQVPADQVRAAGERYGRGAYRPYLGELFYGLNLKSPKFADARFREAIVRAVNRGAIIARVYGGAALPTDGVLVAGVAGHQPDPCGQRCFHDPARARALLAEVFGQSPPPEVQIDYDDAPTQDAVAKAMQADLQAVGIPTALRPKPLEEYKQFALTGEQELFRLGWIAAYPSADAILSPLFVTGSPNNLTGLSVAEIDAGLAAARAEPDPAKRVPLYQAAERAVLAQLPVVPIAQFETHALVAPRVRGLVLTTAATFDGSKVWLATAP